MHDFTHQRFGNVTVAYGFDRPMQEYFLTVEKAEPDQSQNQDVIPTRDEDVIFAVSSHFSLNPHPDAPGKLSYSNSELFDLFEEFGVNEEHKAALALDVPF